MQQYRLQRAENLSPGDKGDTPDGYFLHDPDGRGVAWDEPEPPDGCLILPVAGVGYRGKAPQHSCFEPGQPVLIMPEPDNPYDSDALAIVSANQQRQLGYVRRDDQANVQTLMGSGEPMRAAVIWQWRDDSGQRTGAAIVLARDGVVGGLDGPIMTGSIPKRGLLRRLFSGG